MASDPSTARLRTIAAAGWLLAAGLAGWIAWERIETRRSASSLMDERARQLLVVQGENSLLKRMLGQVDGRVVLLGPTAHGAEARGKLVWDEARQAGYVHITRLTPSKPESVYHLWIREEGGAMVPMGRLGSANEGILSTPFTVTRRIFKIDRFSVHEEGPVPAKPGVEILVGY
jgi:hypothetical protein